MHDTRLECTAPQEEEGDPKRYTCRQDGRAGEGEAQALLQAACH